MGAQACRSVYHMEPQAQARQWLYPGHKRTYKTYELQSHMYTLPQARTSMDWQFSQAVRQLWLLRLLPDGSMLRPCSVLILDVCWVPMYMRDHDSHAHTHDLAVREMGAPCAEAHRGHDVLCNHEETRCFEVRLWDNGQCPRLVKSVLACARVAYSWRLRACI